MKAIIKKIIPSHLWSKIQQCRTVVDMYLAKLSVKSRFTSSLFYTLFSGQFHREHQAVLAGRLAYQQALNDIQQSNALLRRNIHRLEKGLIMEPRKASFAQAYIVETVDIVEKCLKQADFSQVELKWALDVLTQYFDAVNDTEVIKKARLSFNALLVSSQAQAIAKQASDSSSPYLSEQRLQSNISSDDLFSLFKQRRSVRWFEAKLVEQSLIEQAITMAAQAPSACNRQPFEFYTCTNPTVAAEIASIPTGTKGFSQNVQALIVVMGDLSAYPYERDRHVIYIDGGLVSMQLMLAFESLGLSTCPINWPDIEEYEQVLAKRLNLPVYKRPIMMMAVGYAKKTGGIPFSQKKEAAELIKVVH